MKPDPYFIDDDNPEWTDEMFKNARPAREVLPKILGQKNADILLKKRGRPVKDDKKIKTTIRFDADILEEFRSYGPGWQTEINNALRDWLATHQ